MTLKGDTDSFPFLLFKFIGKVFICPPDNL